MALLTDIGLRPLVPADYPELYRWVTTEGVGDRWRYPGEPPTEAEFVNGLWLGVLEQSMIVRTGQAEPIGLVSSYAADIRSGTCYLALVTSPQFLGTATSLFGAMLFIDQLFRDWPLRMLHLQAYSFNISKLSSLIGRVAHIDGIMRADLDWKGTLHDQYLMTIERSRWDATVGQRLQGLRDRCAARGKAISRDEAASPPHDRLLTDANERTNGDT
jgi:RimJ/RimL family protein N-acetyltransferase